MISLVYQTELIVFNILVIQGILVFASVMATLGLQIILESARSMASGVSPIVFNSH